MDNGLAPPNKRPWPPIILGVAAAGAIGLGWLVPIPGLVPRPLGVIGVLTLFAGAALDLKAIATMREHDANVYPHRAATALVCEFPFSMSRNPIYLGNALLLAGAGLTFRNPWFFLATLGQFLAVTRLAILGEEQHMAAAFGAQWDSYAREVPRWVRMPAIRMPGLRKSTPPVP